MKLWMTAFLFALISLACGGETGDDVPETIQRRTVPLRVVVSPDFDLTKNALLYSAWDEYRVATGGALTVVEDEARADLFIMPSTEVRYGGYAPGRIRLDPRLGDTAFRTVALHELGHAFGLPHYPEGIMRQYDGGGVFVNCLDQYTVDKICEVYPCTNPRNTCGE